MAISSFSIRIEDFGKCNEVSIFIYTILDRCWSWLLTREKKDEPYHFIHSLFNPITLCFFLSAVSNDSKCEYVYLISSFVASLLFTAAIQLALPFFSTSASLDFHTHKYSLASIFDTNGFNNLFRRWWRGISFHICNIFLIII